MYMTMEYTSYGPCGAPVGISLKLKTDGRPKYGRISWDPAKVTDIQVDGSTRMLSGPVSLNGTYGIEPYVMQGAKFLSAFTEKPCNIQVQSVKFTRDESTPGWFVADGLPCMGKSVVPESPSVEEYFNSHGLFGSESWDVAGFHRIAFDSDVTHAMVNEFMDSHPDTTHGTFCDMLAQISNNNPDAAKRSALYFLWTDSNRLHRQLELWQELDKKG